MGSRSRRFGVSLLLVLFQNKGGLGSLATRHSCRILAAQELEAPTRLYWGLGRVGVRVYLLGVEVNLQGR